MKITPDAPEKKLTHLDDKAGKIHQLIWVKTYLVKDRTGGVCFNIYSSLFGVETKISEIVKK